MDFDIPSTVNLEQLSYRFPIRQNLVDCRLASGVLADLDGLIRNLEDKGGDLRSFRVQGVSQLLVMLFSCQGGVGRMSKLVRKVVQRSAIFGWVSKGKYNNSIQKEL